MQSCSRPTTALCTLTALLTHSVRGVFRYRLNKGLCLLVAIVLLTLSSPALARCDYRLPAWQVSGPTHNDDLFDETLEQTVAECKADFKKKPDRETAEKLCVMETYLLDEPEGLTYCLMAQTEAPTLATAIIAWRYERDSSLEPADISRAEAWGQRALALNTPFTNFVYAQALDHKHPALALYYLNKSALGGHQAAYTTLAEIASRNKNKTLHLALLKSALKASIENLFQYNLATAPGLYELLPELFSEKQDTRRLYDEYWLDLQRADQRVEGSYQLIAFLFTLAHNIDQQHHENLLHLLRDFAPIAPGNPFIDRQLLKDTEDIITLAFAMGDDIGRHAATTILTLYKDRHQLKRLVRACSLLKGVFVSWRDYAWACENATQ